MRESKLYSLRLDGQQQPIGHRIEPERTSRRRERPNTKMPTYMHPEAIQVCLNCTRSSCGGECTKMAAYDCRCKPKHGSRSGPYYEHRGQEYTMHELVEISGLTPGSIRARMKRGMTLEQAIETPKEPGRKRKNGQS